MTCPYCGSKARVIDVRHGIDFTVRRYKCFKCENRFFSQEIDISRDEGRKLMTECQNYEKSKKAGNE